MTEMAIVVLIIGLLVSGVAIGASLLKQAQLRAVLAEVEGFKVGIDHFQQLYGYLPGDLPLATGANRFFDGQTTNGDGDGRIDADAPVGTEETFAAWVQLVLARYTNGNYSGASDSGATIGINIPASSHVSGAGYSLAYVAQPGGAQDAIGRYYSGNYLIFASDDDLGTLISGAILPPDDALYLDSKADDGKADSGKIIAGGGVDCIAAGRYVLGSSQRSCYLYFNIQN
jgi:hypothetical protein